MILSHAICVRTKIVVVKIQPKMMVITAQDTRRISVRKQPISTLTGKRSVKDARTPSTVQPSSDQTPHVVLRLDKTSSTAQPSSDQTPHVVLWLDKAPSTVQPSSDQTPHVVLRLVLMLVCIQNELEAYAAHYEAEHTYPPGFADQMGKRDRTCVRNYWEKVLKFMDNGDAACVICGQLFPRVQCNEWTVDQLAAHRLLLGHHAVLGRVLDTCFSYGIGADTLDQTVLDGKGFIRNRENTITGVFVCKPCTLASRGTPHPDWHLRTGFGLDVYPTSFVI